jgi:hypothetical protein
MLGVCGDIAVCVDVNLGMYLWAGLLFLGSRNLLAFIQQDVIHSSIVTTLKYESVGSALGTPPLSIYVHELLSFLQHASENAASLARGS